MVNDGLLESPQGKVLVSSELLPLELLGVVAIASAGGPLVNIEASSWRLKCPKRCLCHGRTSLHVSGLRLADCPDTTILADLSRPEVGPVDLDSKAGSNPPDWGKAKTSEGPGCNVFSRMSEGPLLEPGRAPGVSDFDPDIR